MRAHLHYVHVGTACQVAGCGHTTATEAGMRVHIRQEHFPFAERSQYECGWDNCGEVFSTWTTALECFHKHQAIALTAVVTQKQQD
ncbi:hypothetical protein PG996_010081 [Apiospora saccharicola]|uniref:C2H2-type domain-containing protein n=1 Tax=Apiospora saccharicola TaxID=335842 RepID=A0ABR1UMK9_9PEZI